MEILDIYDSNRMPTGRTFVRLYSQSGSKPFSADAADGRSTGGSLGESGAGAAHD